MANLIDNKNDLTVRKGRALVIDDSPSVRRILIKILNSLGFSDIIEAENGRQGIEHLDKLEQTKLPDIAMVDWNMPVMDGYSFLCNIRTERKYDNMPIVLVTTVSEQYLILKALEAGANEFVMKPFTKDTIIDKLTMLGISINIQ